MRRRGMTSGKSSELFWRARKARLLTLISCRRMSRLYDTALRKDGMYPAADRIKKAKIEFDRNTSDSICKNLNAYVTSHCRCIPHAN